MPDCAARCEALLVTPAEWPPVNELAETAYKLEDGVGVSLGPVVANGCYPDLPGLDADPAAAAAESGTSLRRGEAATLAAAAEFRRDRMALQAEQLTRLNDALPLPQLRLPYLFDAELGPAQLDQLAAALLAGVHDLPAPHVETVEP